MKNKLITLLLFATLFTGCQRQEIITDPIVAVEAVAADLSLESGISPQTNRTEQDAPVIVKNGFYIPNTLVQIPDRPVDLSINIPYSIGDIMKTLAVDFDWSVRFMPDADPDVKITAQLTNVNFDDALLDLAESAGYTVIFDWNKRRAIVTRRATWTFLFPPHVLNAVKWDYSVGGNPVQSQSGEELAQSLEASSKITGSHQQDTEGALAFLRQAVNVGNSEGEVAAEITSSLQGILLVRGNFNQLNRAESVIKRIIDDAMTRVEINAAIVEVSSQNTDEVGIDWGKIINADVLQAKNINLLGREIASPSFTTSITKRSLNFVLKALNVNTDLNIVTRPNLLIDNHTPADLVDASVVPYLSSVEATVDESGNISYSAESENAISGLKISVLPHVFSPNQVKLTLLPFLGDIPNFQTFTYGTNGSLTLPNQFTKQALLSVTLADGETLVLAGNRVNSDSRGKSGLPGISTPLTDSHWNADTNKEVAILINVRILPPAIEKIVLEKAL